MYRASTPRHYFNIPFDASEISQLKLTYAQNGETVLEKSKDDFTIDGNVWCVTLTQTETNLFKADVADVQIRVLFTDGTSLPSKTFCIRVGAVLNDEVME